MKIADCMSCRARGCGEGDVIEYNRTTGTVVECRRCGFVLKREERESIAAYYERAIESALAERDAGEAERVAAAVARERAAREKAEADAAALRAALGDFAERDCDYGDGCPPFGTRHGQCDGCRARKALRAISPAPEPVAADVDAALATIDESISCQFGLTFDGTTIKGCTPDLEDGGTSKKYLDADDCRALAGAFGVVAGALAAARKGG